MKVIIALLGLMLMGGCVGLGGMSDAPSGTGVSQVFKAGFDETSAAAIASVQATGVDVKNTEKVGNDLTILFSKPMSAFSWGEVGRVTVKPIDAQTTMVSVLGAKKYKLQLTGTSQQDFATAIFNGITTKLQKAPM